MKPPPGTREMCIYALRREIIYCPSKQISNLELKTVVLNTVDSCLLDTTWLYLQTEGITADYGSIPGKVIENLSRVWKQILPAFTGKWKKY